MHLELDVDQLRAALALLRQELEAAPDADTLARLSASLRGSLDLLHVCRVAAGDEAGLARLADEIRECKAWADESGAALRLIASVQDIAR